MNVIITGGSKGIGKAIAMKFASGGYSLLLCARNEIALRKTAEEISTKYPGCLVNSMPADLSDKNQITAFSDWCLEQGAPGILVNNAGFYLPGKSYDEPEGSLEAMMNANFYSAYYLSRKLIPAMIKNGNGHIFNMGSIASLDAYEGGGGYSISKFALHGFTKNLRHELKSRNIKVTEVLAGAVMTDSWAGFDNSKKRIMEPEDVAAMIFAASQLSPQAVVEEIILRPQLGDL